MINKLIEMGAWVEKTTDFVFEIYQDGYGLFTLQFVLGRLTIDLIVNLRGQWTWKCNKKISIQAEDPIDLILGIRNYYTNVYLVKLKRRERQFK